MLMDQQGFERIFLRKTGISSPIMTEALAVREVLTLAQDLCLDQFIIECDNLTLMFLRVSRTAPGISDILLLMTSFRNAQISHIFREANEMADKIAKLGHGTLPKDMLINAELKALIRKDAIG
ncbi:LOW QUALITY PROTEIN: hypothetical protein V2J09_018173 [Rumex salicifolius]